MKHLEKRLKLEIMKVLVYPNLDDEVLPFLNHIQYSLGGNGEAAGASKAKDGSPTPPSSANEP